jgi:lysophospholipase L1-like esterase
MKILVIGDSYSAAREADTGLDRGWPEALGIDVGYRQAVSGSTAQQWAANLGNRLSTAQATQSDIVIMSLLGNDAFAALATGGVDPAKAAAGLAHLEQVFNAVKRKRTIVLLYPDPFSGVNKEFRVGTPILNAAVRYACGPDSGSIGAEFLDLGTVLKPEHFNGTDIHPTIEGHKVLAAALAKLLAVDAPAPAPIFPPQPAPVPAPEPQPEHQPEAEPAETSHQ